jgi:UDP-N-acetylmuramoyl-tripeptide--D-alanyl-D-alanine ligase
MASSASFTSVELAEASGGEWRGGRLPAQALTLCTDSREPASGSIFIAFRGEKFDAHDFLDAAVAHGAAALCVERRRAADLPLPAHLPVLVVEDTLAAYQRLARLHRRRFPALRIAAVTGSVGKTSVKEMLSAICRAACGGDGDGVLSTIGNTNNYFGVPQNLLRLTARHRYAVLEIGTNHHGEIAPLSRIVEPQVALINSIAPCHLEFLGSLAGVAEEKAHIFDGLAPDGVAVIPLDAPEAAILEAKAAKFKVLRFGAEAGADVRAEYRRGTLDGSEFMLDFGSGGPFTVEWPLTGEHQARNAAAAAAAALALGIAPEVIAAGLRETKLPGMRMARSRIGSVTYVNDAYNANPESMAASLRMLAGMGSQDQLVLVLGDMLELGEFEADGHRDTLLLARERLPAAAIIAVGPRFRAAAAAAALPVEVCADAAAAGEALKKYRQPGRVVFLKGSRAMALEKALPEG